MHRFHRMHLSPEAAIARLEAIDLEEKSRLAEGIALIAVIDHRRDYLAAGYPCTLDFCVGRLRMSQDRALKRIQVARVALRLPEILECLGDGRLSVCTASVLAPHLTPETAAALLEAAAFRSRREILRLLGERSRADAPPPIGPESPSTVQDTSDSYAPGHMDSLSDLLAPPASDAIPSSVAPAQVEPSRRGRVYGSATGDHEVRLSITDEEHDDLCRAQALLGHAVPSGDPALVYARAMKHYLAHLEKQRLGVKRTPAASVCATDSAPPTPRSASKASGGRGISKTMRRQVWERDSGRCTFVGTDGHRCGATRRLEFDHVLPVAQGGGTTPENLRLLCRAHNQFEAERLLGKDHVQRKRDMARFEREKAKAAAKAGTARKQARDEAMQARHDDLHAALRGLGFRQADTQRGAALADAMPQASLETCLRHALTVLTRATASHGERLARCSA